MDVEKKSVGIIPASVNYHLDHLAVICSLMNIPLMCIDDSEFDFASKFYPGLDVRKIEYEDFKPEYFINHYDVLFASDPWDRETFQAVYQKLEQQYQKQLRYVFCPHGFSDKGFYFKECADEDILLVYGQNMLDQFKHHEVLERLHSYVMVGNYRLTYYKMHRQFYDHLVKDVIVDHFDKSRTTILYAPTWFDGEQSSSFFDAASILLDRLPSEYNIIVKLHPRLELDDIAQYYHIIGKYEDRPNILFLKDFSPVYPILAYADIYIGDMSSVGYDFLSFNKPMFFLTKGRQDSNSRNAYLHRCGIEITPDQYEKTFQIIENNLRHDQEFFGKIREDVYHYTFGDEKSFSEIKKDIIEAYNKPRIL
jgi:hypothetical protein